MATVDKIRNGLIDKILSIKNRDFLEALDKMISERTKQIADNPLIYKGTDFTDVRVASLGNFSIYYKVSEENIIITAFWDNRQDPKELLKILENKK